MVLEHNINFTYVLRATSTCTLEVQIRSDVNLQIQTASNGKSRLQSRDDNHQFCLIQEKNWCDRERSLMEGRRKICTQSVG